MAGRKNNIAVFKHMYIRIYISIPTNLIRISLPGVPNAHTCMVT